MDSYTIQAGNETLFRQAPATAHDYMTNAVKDIDAYFGKGFAKAHPELIAAYMQTAAIDMSGAVIARAVETLADAVEQVSNAIEEAKGGDHG